MIWAQTVRTPPPGLVWSSSTSLGGSLWHYVLSIDVRTPWKLHGSDLYPITIPDTPDMTAAAGVADGAAPAAKRRRWVAHQWFTAGHRETACVDGSFARAAKCIAAVVASAAEIPALHNTRPIMVQNDTHRFDLLELAPV